MAEKSIIIIGAGIAGLCAGCYGQMNGYQTRIFEMHTIPGGLCTAWKRKGYKIDGCIHWLVGSSPGNSFYRFWEEVGAVQGRTMVDPEEFVRIEGKEGKVFIVYSDTDRLEQHMKELAPEDKDVIDEFINAIHRYLHFEMPIEKAPELYSAIDGLKLMFKMCPYLGFMKKWGKISTQEFAQRFQNPFLRQAFSSIINVPDFPMLYLIGNLSYLHQKSAGYPLGGSLEFARAIEKRYLGLGGEIHYKAPVAKILVENDRTVGVQLADGSEHHSDIVISAADGRTTIFDMLEGKYVNEEIQGYYEKLPIFSPIIYIALGVARLFNELPHSAAGINFPLDEPITIAGQELKRLPVHIYNFDPTLSPKGKTLLTIMLDSNYEHWKKLSEEPERYKTDKEQIADKVVAALDRRFPGLSSQVEMRDVATPMTFERYTGNWQGTYEGWLVTTKNLNLRMSKTLPGLEDFYMAGQWIQPGGGLPTGVMTGRHVIQIICKNDKKKFVTSTP